MATSPSGPNGGDFPLTPNPSPTAPDERARLMEAPAFGTVFTDHMARATWREGEGWGERGIVPFEHLRIHPGASGLNYGQQVFEGFKAYRGDDGVVRMMRPAENARRFRASAARIALPELPEEDFLAATEGVVRADRDWVPTTEGSSLYLRPLLYGAEGWLAVRPSRVAEFVLLASPVGPYFPGGVKPISVWVAQGFHRAVVGGTGEAKAGGNYGAAMLPQRQAEENGCDQVLFLDAATREFVEELGAMNLFVVFKDGSVATPHLTGTILEGVVRDSVLALLRASGHEVSERRVGIDELREGTESGEVTEMFACGTAAAIVPVGRLVSPTFDVSVGDGEPGELTMSVRERLMGIQYGRVEDEFGWMRVVD